LDLSRPTSEGREGDGRQRRERGKERGRGRKAPPCIGMGPPNGY